MIGTLLVSITVMVRRRVTIDVLHVIIRHVCPSHRDNDDEEDDDCDATENSNENKPRETYKDVSNHHHKYLNVIQYNRILITSIMIYTIKTLDTDILKLLVEL